MTRHTQLFLASTLYGVATLAAAVDEHRFPVADRRLLVITDNTPTPELARSADRMPGFDALARRFDAVVSYNDAIEPLHPAGWSPRPAERPLLERHLRLVWGLGDDDLHLVVESIQVDPARTFAAIFADAGLDVYADGLMSYGPTRNPIEPAVASRIERLLHVDLVPGLRPLLLSEWDVPAVRLCDDTLRAVFAEAADDPAVATVLSRLADDMAHTTDGPTAVLLGQYLSALGILTEDEERELHLGLLEEAIGRGARSVIFKPHPSASAALSEPLVGAAAAAGVRFTVLTDPVPAEVIFARLPVALVLGCFSTGLITAGRLYRIPTVRLGTGRVLEALRPFHNSNRVPLTLVDLLVDGPDRPSGTVLPDHPGGHHHDHGADANVVPPRELQALVDTLGYVMQPVIYQDRREEARVFLTEHFETYRRYFRRRRLTRLELPGRLPSAGPGHPARRFRRYAGRQLRRLIGAPRRPAEVRAVSGSPVR